MLNNKHEPINYKTTGAIYAGMTPVTGAIYAGTTAKLNGAICAGMTEMKNRKIRIYKSIFPFPNAPPLGGAI